MANPGHEEGYNLEYRDKNDDSWYSVRVVIQGETMTVKYEGYSEVFNVTFDAKDFKCKEEMDELVGRFRYVSPQVQDSECGSLKEGMKVCVACNAFGPDDMLYYDAEIEAIHNVDHSFVNGDEECLCTFVISWLHGPKKGSLTTTRIEGMCAIKDIAQVDPTIDSFSKLVNQNLRKSSCKLTSASKYESPASKGSCCGKGGSSLSSTSSCEGIDTAKSIIDETTGGLLVENLERDLSPSSFRDFIHEHTSVSSQAYILPSPSMPYARGIIVVDCEEKLQKIHQFLDNPSHLIVSSTGRPLVITERDLRYDMMRMWPESMGDRSQDMCTSLEKDLMVVHSGTEAYERAKQLKDLYQEFTNHLRVLYKKLFEEEMMILQAQQTVQPSSQLKDLFQEFTNHLRRLSKRFSMEEMMILQAQQAV